MTMGRPSPGPWVTFFHQLTGLERKPGFDTATHAEVFGHDIDDWVWVGWTEGFDEHLHAWKHPSGKWVVLPVTTSISEAPDSSRVWKMVRVHTFDLAPPETRRGYMSRVRRDALVGESFEALAEKLLNTPTGLGAPMRATDPAHVARLRGLLSLAVTDEERAVALAYGLLSP